MHGIIVSELQRYVESLRGPVGWPLVLDRAGLPGRVYAPFGSFPDEEVRRLMLAGSEVLGMPMREMLFGYGVFLAPRLLELYRHRIDPAWGPIELLEHTEVTIHEVLRAKDPHASPPRLDVVRTSPRSVVLRYASPRRLCDVARGILDGIARHYGQGLEVHETACMHEGAARCELSVSAKVAR